jgi:hypothetical protein
MNTGENKHMKVMTLMTACWRKWGDGHQSDMENEAKGLD